MNHDNPVVTLRWADGSVVLPDGQYLVGRSTACDVVIDDPRVSRRHAQIEVDGVDVHVVDLESRNGVFVNDRPVRRMQALAEGDVILIGGAEITMDIEEGGPGSIPRRPPQAFVVLPEPSSTDVTEELDDGEPVRVTKTFDDLELIGRVAERALAAGHVRQAEAMVESHLRRVLDDALNQRDVSERTTERAIKLGLSLAQATHRGRWFDFTIDLLRARRVVCSASLIDRLVRTQQGVDRVDRQCLKRYIDTLRADGPTMEELRAAQRLQDFLHVSVPPKGR